ncbi:MAG: FtsQ-type POTRA domain-containing protein, partial [Oscillospiraceae bacterium]|nr:FtsQ-type POTRA domain-containing protein [Oscillospiraceae bacterium]
AAIILGVLAVIISLSAFFRVTEITVTGNNYYTDEDIIEASGIEVGDNLVLLKQSGAVAKIRTEYLCVDEVQIERTPPGSVEIKITESTPAGFIRDGNDYWIINESCRLLENTNKSGVTGLIEIKGVTITEPQVGDTINTGDTTGLVTEYLSAVLKEAVKQGIASDISYLDIRNITNITFTYDNRFTVKMGRGESVEIKFKNLTAVTDQIGKTETGIIDIADENETHFSPN